MQKYQRIAFFVDFCCYLCAVNRQLTIMDGFVGERFRALQPDAVALMQSMPQTLPLYIISLGHFPQAHNHYVARPFGTDEYILLYCTEGEGWVELAGHRTDLLANQFIVLPPHVAHAYGSRINHAWSLYWVHFRGSAAASIAEDLNVPHAIEPSPESRISERIALFDDIYSSLEGPLSADSLSYACMAFAHMMATLRFIDVYRHSKEPVSEPAAHSIAVVHKAMHYMEEHLESHLGINELSAFCGLSRSRLYRLFVRETGESPISYYTRLKINRACLLLTQTQMSISQIALKLSFSEPQFFARTFKRLMGVSATTYRASTLNPPT